MRVFVSFREMVHSLDVDILETVGDIKNTLRERFGLNLNNHRHETDSFVSLVYQGSALQDSWTYSDLGIPPGSTLICRVEKQVDVTLAVHCVNYDETIVYKRRFDVWGTSVGTIRGMIQTSTGVHVSAFRLYSESGLELFDCHLLKVYGVDAGDTITMVIWRDVADVVQAARENDITDTLGSSASFQESPHLMRYHLQLGLFTAAHYGYHQLATQLMKCGARPDEPVGQHPSRDWCRSSAHADHVKTPAHEAAQHGRLKCLQHFLMFNHAVLICKDAHGLTPCNIARRFKQTECFKLLVAEQFRIPSVHPELSVHVYARVRKWCDRARLRTRLHKDKTAMLLLTNAEVTQKRAVVGQKVEVDGYNGLERREVKSAPSGLTTCNARNYDSAHSISRGNLESTPKSILSDAYSFVQVKRTKSDISSQVTRNGDQVSACNARTTNYNNARAIKLHDISKTTYQEKRQNTNVRQNSRELPQRHKALADGAFYSMTCSKDEDFRHANSTPKAPLKSSTTPRVSRAGNTREEHEQSRRSTTRREQTFLSRVESGRSGKEQNSRYIWKSVDDQENRRISRDIRGQTITPAINDQQEPIISPNDTISGNSSSKKIMPQDDRSVLSRSKIGTDRRSSYINKQYVATQKGEESHQPNSPLKRRSAQSRDLVYQSSVDSTADKCLRVACETFRKKSWMGQLQMALVVNSNMCKRRHNVLK